MAFKDGFFNSVNGDRLYNAEDVNRFLEGLISSNGIFANVGDEMVVTPSSGMVLNVGTGKAMVNARWCSITDKPETVTISSAHATLNRIDRIVLRHDVSSREVYLHVIEGANSSNPSIPPIVRNSEYYDISLARVYVAKGATAITANRITDERLNSNVCGYITGLVQQLNTSQFNNQLRAWQAEQEAEFETWEDNQQDSFEAWFSTLTDELTIETFIDEYTKEVTGTGADLATTLLNGYTYNAKDIFFVSVNGFTLSKTEYTITPSGSSCTIGVNVNSDVETNKLFVRVLKSRIGWDTLTDSNGNQLVDNEGNGIAIGG